MCLILFTCWVFTLYAKAILFYFHPNQFWLTKIYIIKHTDTRLESKWPKLRLYGRNYVFVAEFRMN